MTTDTFTVAVEKLVYGGDGIGRRDGKAVFVPGAVPGDELLVRAVAEKAGFTRAEIVRVVAPGEGRVQPACPHAGVCGGCDWQQLDYPRQVEAKRLILEELLHHRLPATRDLEISMRPCPRPFGYRSRARLRIRLDEAGGTAVGFFRRSSHTVQDIESCLLFRPALDEALRELRRSLRDKEARARLAPLRVKGASGFARPGGAASGQGAAAPQGVREIDIACSDEGKGDGGRGGAGVIGWLGDETPLQKEVGPFRYHLSAGTFFQANDFLVESLVDETMRRAGGGRAALDLYSGVRLFTLPLARRFAAVAAVEASRASVGFCSRNAAEARCLNVMAVCADAAAWLRKQDARSFDCVVLDPPRAGVAKGVMEDVARLAPETVVYVSCDPQTLARDLGRLDAGSYRVESVTGFDLFPQTHHFETVVKLARTK